MVTFAAADPGRQSVEDSIRSIFDSIFSIVEYFSELGGEWGEPWGTLLPVFVAIGIAFGFVGGVRYLFWHMQEKIRPVFFVVLALVGLVAFAAIRSADNDVDATENSLNSD
jgi:uncharacterized membrane protein YbhN (UPF0104 family)